MSTLDKVKHKAQVAKGEAKKAAGWATNDRSLEAKGVGDKVAGNLKQAGDKVKDAARSLKKKSASQSTAPAGKSRRGRR